MEYRPEFESRDDVKDIKVYEARERIAHAKEEQNAKKKITDGIGTFRLVSKEHTDEDHRSYIIERNDGVQYKLTVEYGNVRSGRVHKDRYGNIFSQEKDKPMRVLKASYEIPNTAEKFEFEASVEPNVAQEKPQSVDKNFAHNLKMARLGEYQKEQAEKLWQMLVVANEPIIKTEQRKPQLTKHSSQEARERIAHAKEKQNAKKKITDGIGTFRLVSKEHTDEDHRSYIIERNDGVQYKLTVEYGNVRSGRVHKDRYGNIFSQEKDKPMRVLKASYEIPNTAEKFEFEASVEPNVAQEKPQSVDKNFAHNLKMARLGEYQKEQAEKLWQMLVVANEPIIKTEQRKPQLTKHSSQYE